VVANPGRPDVLAEVIRAMASGSGGFESLAAMGTSGRTYVERNFDRNAVLRQWDTLLANLVGP
jgi:hypothetical protein